MRPARLKALFCPLLSIALLVASCQYLSHFHVPRGDAAVSAHVDAEKPAAHAAEEHCALCLQFDRLPAPPTPAAEPIVFFAFLATVETERLVRLARQAPHLWPPSRGPPVS